MSGTLPQVMLIAGETSGDMLGAELVDKLQQQQKPLRLTGMGSQRMRDAGVELVIDSEQLAIVGLWDILVGWRRIRSAFKTLRKHFETDPPDLLVLIDYPGFNLRLAKIAKEYKIKVLYYVSPQIWAWRYHRINEIKQYVDHMAVLFEFERELYAKENVPVTFVGHPLVERIHTTLSKPAAYLQFQLVPDQPIVALLPGSRRKELSRHLPEMIKACREIKASVPDAQFVLPLSDNLSSDDLPITLPDHIRLVEKNLHNVLQLCTAAITVSGTATLDVALQQVPMIIIYKMDPLGFFIGYYLLRIRLKFFGLCNIVAETEAAKELLQRAVKPKTIAKEIIRLLKDLNYRESKHELLKLIPRKLGHRGGSERMAKLTLDVLTQS